MTHQECVMAMGTAYPAHAWHGQDRWCNGTRCQIDNTFTIWPGTSNTLRRALAYEQTIAWTSYILLSRWCVSYGLCKNKQKQTLTCIGKQTTRRNNLWRTYCGLVALTAFNDVLIPLSRNVYHCLTNSAGDHRHAALDGRLIRRW